MRARALAIPLVLLATAVTGCAGAGDGAADGHFVRYHWGQDSASCQNGVCRYGQNAEAFDLPLECDTAPRLTWDTTQWRHGSIAVEVLDDAGEVALRATVGSVGKH